MKQLIICPHAENTKVGQFWHTTPTEKIYSYAVEPVDNQYAWQKKEFLAVKAVDIHSTTENITVRQLKQLIIHTPSIQQ